MSEQIPVRTGDAVEMFVPADERWTRPYARVVGLDGLAVWYAWSSERTGWIELHGPPVFALRAATAGAEGGERE